MGCEALTLAFVIYCMVIVGALAEDRYDARRHFSTRTPYYHQGDVPDTIDPVGCVPIHLQGLLRHGARNPGPKDITLMRALQAKLASLSKEIQQSANAWVLVWTCQYDPGEAHLLVRLGELEHYQLGKELRAKYPALLKTPYNANCFEFVHTQVSRAGQSASSFVAGLFEGTGGIGECGQQPVHMRSEPIDTDIALRFYTVCKKYKRLHEGSEARQEVSAYQKSPTLKNVALNVARQLGVGEYEDLFTIKDLVAMYRACSYDTYTMGVTSPWCTLLGPDGIEAIEYRDGVVPGYRDELKQWWKKSYGYQLNYMIACPLLSDMLRKLDEAAAGGSKVATIRFGHAETVMPFVTLLGLFHDEAGLYANATLNEMRGRKFRASYIAPYAANAYFVLYACQERDHRLRFVLNGRPYALPGCPAVDCPYSTARRVLEGRFQTCDFEHLCEMRLGKGGKPPTIWDALHSLAQAIGLFDHV